jgi:psp operon transcriptional activator
MVESTNIIGQSVAIQNMLAHVSALAPLQRPVLILGERGTGKELIANRLTYLSPRWNRPFLTINCGALSESVLDSELFGHEAGAFTGAVRRRSSRFELADGGTIFLDEIANASPAVQEKLLRLIEYGMFERVGGNDTVQVDVRIIAGTNADLRNTGFRADLLDRLAFDVIIAPPLRERAGDIMVLASHFAARMTAELKRDFFPGFAQAATARLNAHHWPGNVRELRNVVERSVYRMDDVANPLHNIILDPFDGFSSSPALPPAPGAPPLPEVLPAGRFREQVDRYERALLQAALQAARFSQTQAALDLGLSYHQFRGLLKKHRLNGS